VSLKPATDGNTQAVAIEEVLAARSIHRISTTLDSFEADVADRVKSVNADLPANQKEKDDRPCDQTSSPCALSKIPISTLWGLDFHCVDMPQTLQYIEQIVRDRRPTFAVTANLNYAMLCAQHTRLKEFTRKAALVLCDGMPILWRSKCNKNPLPERVTGSDLIFRLAERSAQTKLRLYLYGAAEGVAAKAPAIQKYRCKSHISNKPNPMYYLSLLANPRASIGSKTIYRDSTSRSPSKWEPRLTLLQETHSELPNYGRSLVANGYIGC
jgi:hypothetical protein